MLTFTIKRLEEITLADEKAMLDSMAKFFIDEFNGDKEFVYSHSERYEYVFVRCNDEVVGMTIIDNMSNVKFIPKLYVRDESRGLGVGKALIDYVFNRIETNHVVQLGVLKEDDKLLDWYLGQNFIPYKQQCIEKAILLYKKKD